MIKRNADYWKMLAAAPDTNRILHDKFEIAYECKRRGINLKLVTVVLEGQIKFTDTPKCIIVGTVLNEQHEYLSMPWTDMARLLATSDLDSPLRIVVPTDKGD